MGQLIKGIFEILLSVMEVILQTASDFAVSAVKSKRRGVYDAHFGLPQDVLRKNGGGFTISDWSNSVSESHTHMVVFGGSGSGKSTVVSMQTALNVDDVSLVINDSGGDMLSLAPSFIKRGYEVLVFDCDNASASEGFCAASKCRTDADSYKLALTVTLNDESTKDSDGDFWIRFTQTLISFFHRYLMKFADPQFCNLSSVLSLINTLSHSPEKIDKLMSETTPDFLDEYKAIVAIPDKTLLSVIATAKSVLNIYAMDNVKQVCSFDTIDFDSFRKKKTVLFLRTSAADTHLYGGIIASFFEMFWAHILRSEPNPKSYPIYFIIEEAATMVLNSLSSAVSLLRKHHCSIALFFQDYNQIEHLYGKHQAANIVANCSLKVFMTGSKPLATCEMIESMIGTFQFDDQGTLRERKLLTAQEIRELTEILILYSNKPPILLPVVPWYVQPRLRRMMKGPTYVAPNKLPFTTPPIIKL